MCSGLGLELSVPRYFFHLAHDQTYPDLRGVELDDIEDAALEAARFAIDRAGKFACRHWKPGEWTMSVTDGDDLQLLAITFWANHPESCEP